jgi:hypothetical protein
MVILYTFGPVCMDVGLAKTKDVETYVGAIAVNDGIWVEDTIVCRVGSFVAVSEGLIVSSSLIGGEGEVRMLAVSVDETSVKGMLEGVFFANSSVWDNNWQEMVLKILIKMTSSIK